MRRGLWQLVLGVCLVMLSFALFLVHYEIYHDIRFVIDWFMGSIAFLPISVLFVTLILDRAIAGREKEALMGKLNMVVGAFFSEAGGRVISMLVKYANVSENIKPSLLPDAKWKKKEFSAAVIKLKGYFYGFDAAEIDLVKLRNLLASKREFLLRLLENQNILEHETFTDLLWALFHVTEELESRKNLNKLSRADLSHISGDIQRAYVLIVVEWIKYMEHLKKQYPYLYSLAVRTNPFDGKAKAEIE
jgi:hypothetical protein